MLQISGLFIYPIKSMAGIPVQSAIVTPTGFEHDRRWMLVDENYKFISQREVPIMALFKVGILENGVLVSYLSHSLKIPFTPVSNQEYVKVTIWDDTCEALIVGAQFDSWFSDCLGTKCHLVYMPDNSKRQVDEQYAKPGIITSFSDAYPFLLIGQSSLDELNSRLENPLPMNRFRPNIVFEGGAPFEEDNLAHIKIGNIDFYGVKLCARCNVTTINQEDGILGKEPLKTLAAYRRKNNKIYFGQNLIHEGNGAVTIGDNLTIIARNTMERFIV